MSDVEQGGPAFPRPGFEQPADMQEGMTLRDWFAGQALAGLCADNVKLIAARDAGQTVAGFTATTSYEIADAMLAARAQAEEA